MNIAGIHFLFALAARRWLAAIRFSEFFRTASKASLPSQRNVTSVAAA
jgi:hypothetical protein